MEPIIFSNQLEFRSWLKKNHKKEKELLVGYHKVETGKPSMTWSQSVDEALCYGWIDGVRKSIDEESYSIRFTPRNPKSKWSAVNIAKMKKLIEDGLMQPAGLEVYEKRTSESTNNYSFEREQAKLNPEQEKIFKKNKIAYNFFNEQPASYKKMVLHWITCAKLESTQLTRLQKTIEESEKGERLFSKYNKK